MNINFNGQVAIVTGAGNGLGKCHALELARLGAKVVVNDYGSSSQASDKVVSEIVKAGGEAVAINANVANFDDCRQMVKDTVAKWGRIDILINNAGILRDKSFSKMDIEQWNSVVDVHLNGSANCSLAVWNQMREQNYGRILMTTSTSGIYGNFGQSNYGAAKMGVIGLMNTLCIEGSKNSIKINCISPTAATSITEDILTPQMKSQLKPEYVTPAALYLISKDAPNRTVMFAGAGTYSTMEIRESVGITLPEDDRTADEIARKFAAISDMSNSRIYTQGMEHVMRLVQNANS